MNNRTRFITLSRALPALAASAFALAPLASVSMAKPPSHAPAHGYYKNKDKSAKSGKYRGNKNDRKSDRNNNRYDGPIYDNGSVYDNNPVEVPYGNVDSDYRDGRDRERRVVEGVVRGDVSGQRFTLRSDDGRTLTVRARSGAPARLSEGDRVRIEGFERSGRNASFVAESVVILSNSNGGFGGGYNGDNSNGRRVSFPATVLDRDNSRLLRVRGDNGRTYTVESRYELARVDDGDRVRVEGVSRAGVVANAGVTLLRNNDVGYGYDDADRGEFTGRVSRVDSDDNFITVRDDRTGRSYTFRPREVEDFRVGQRVRATIGVRDGRTVLLRVTRI